MYPALSMGSSSSKAIDYATTGFRYEEGTRRVGYFVSSQLPLEGTIVSVASV